MRAVFGSIRVADVRWSASTLPARHACILREHPRRERTRGLQRLRLASVPRSASVREGRSDSGSHPCRGARAYARGTATLLHPCREARAYARGTATLLHPCRESRAYARGTATLMHPCREARAYARGAATLLHPCRERALRERALPHGLCALRLGDNRPCWSEKEETKSGQKGTKKRPEIENAAKTRKRVNFRPESKKFIIIV
jgi:hypothetical protein